VSPIATALSLQTLASYISGVVGGFPTSVVLTAPNYKPVQDLAGGRDEVPTHRRTLLELHHRSSMSSVHQICFLSACSNALLQPKARNLTTALVGANRRPTTNWRRHRHHPYQHRKRFRPASSSASLDQRHGPASFVYCPSFLQKTSRSFSLAGRHNDVAPTAEQMSNLNNSLEEAMLGEAAPELPPRASQRSGGVTDSIRSTKERASVSEELPPPSVQLQRDDVNETRSMRSESSVSRNSNRLSLTLPLPIAPPNALPTRPTPTSSTMASYPPTPLDTPSIMSPLDPGDVITAIAAQERRVLDLREELERAENQLTQLKRQWANNEAHKSRPKARKPEPLRPIIPHIDTPDDPPSRRSIELDKRKALLLAQGTPTQNRRRVFTGSHTRTLSLLSPLKTTGDGFAVHEDAPAPGRELRRTESLRSPANEPESPSLNGYAPFVPTSLSKRASWAPRSVHQQTNGVKQIAEDFKAGLWTFMEDLRQATVGEEPITGQGTYLRGIDGNMRSTSRERDSGANQDTIRASAPPRARATSAFDYDGTPTPMERYTDEDETSEKEKENVEASTLPARSKSLSKTAKHTKRFSLTPLSMDTFDDDDSWSSWETPAKSPRWSGSTVNGDLISVPDEITTRSSP
jgi:hypothetical protein